MRLAGAGRLVFDLTFPNGPRSKEIAQILQKQWRAHLGAEVRLIVHETNVWIQTLQAVAYRGIIECNWMPGYVDPYGMLELFDGRSDGSGWKDPEFRKMIARANAEPDPAARLRKLAACEQRLLRAMPVLPLFFDSYAYLQKPYVKGMRAKSSRPARIQRRLDRHELEAVMTRFDRRTLLGLGPLTLAGCSSQSPYFGRTNPPVREQLICNKPDCSGTRPGEDG